MSLFNLEIDLTVIAGFLALVGYSVNDTVIVCDRIRENMGKLHDQPMAISSTAASTRPCRAPS